MFRLDGKIAAVTGSNGLLGKQFCRALAEAGATVIPLDLKGTPSFDVMKEDLPECDILVNAARTGWEGMYRMAMMHKGDNIINISSVYGCIAPDMRIYEGTEITTSPAAYSADKAAVIGLTRHLAGLYYNTGIRVNCISPGGIDDAHGKKFKANYSITVPMQRMAKPNEMNGALIFLSSDASSYVNGHNLIVDGGRSIW